MKHNNKTLKKSASALLAVTILIGSNYMISNHINFSDTPSAVVYASDINLKLNKSVMSLGLKEKFQLIANTDVTWRTSAPKILTVDKTGNVTAVGKGTAWITASDKNGKEKSCKITVKNEPFQVNLNKTSLTIGVGEKYKLTSIISEDAAAAVRSFRTSDSSIIKMTRTNWEGEFIAVKEGTAWVTVKLYNGIEKSCKVTVKKPPLNVNISKSTLTLGVGETYTLSAVIPDNTGSAKRTFRSSDSSVIKMNKTDWTGSFTALKEGTVWVTVRTYNGKESSCKITVKSSPKSVSLNKSILYLHEGEKANLNAIIPANTGAATRTFRTSNSKIVKMDKTNWTGEFTAVSEGIAWVTVKLYNGIEKSCKIIVRNKPYIELRNGVTYVDGILIANKTYSLPPSYGNGLQPDALNAFNKMASDAAKDGIYLYIVSGYRSYDTQAALYSSYCSRSGKEAADRFSARPGHSEHQTGLAMDVNSVYDSFAYTPEAKWLKNNCYKYGFIIRYPEGKEHITGYKYESWHIRYLGTELSKTLYESGETLEEYLGITSQYNY